FLIVSQIGNDICIKNLNKNNMKNFVKGVIVMAIAMTAMSVQAQEKVLTVDQYHKLPNSLLSSIMMLNRYLMLLWKMSFSRRKSLKWLWLTVQNLNSTAKVNGQR